MRAPLVLMTGVNQSKHNPLLTLPREQRGSVFFYSEVFYDARSIGGKYGLSAWRVSCDANHFGVTHGKD